MDAAWNRYTVLIPQLPALTARARSLAAPILRSIAALFGDDDESLAIKLTLFVGQFDNNAFAGPIVDNVPTVYLPVEMTDADVALAHEFAHAVHKHVGHLKSGYVAPIGETLLMEGIASTQHSSCVRVVTRPHTPQRRSMVRHGLGLAKRTRVRS